VHTRDSAGPPVPKPQIIVILIISEEEARMRQLEMLE
jgi:hypothetical protein